MTEEKNRKKFYRELQSLSLPDEWDIEDGTVYTSIPTFRRKLSEKDLVVSVLIDEKEETTLVTSVQTESTKAIDYDLRLRWSVDTAEEAAVCLVKECIPKLESEEL